MIPYLLRIKSQKSPCLLLTEQEDLDMEESLTVLERSQQQWPPPQGRQSVSHPLPATQQQSKKSVIPFYNTWRRTDILCLHQWF